MPEVLLPCKVTVGGGRSICLFLGASINQDTLYCVAEAERTRDIAMVGTVQPQSPVNVWISGGRPRSGSGFLNFSHTVICRNPQTEMFDQSASFNRPEFATHG